MKKLYLLIAFLITFPSLVFGQIDFTKGNFTADNIKIGQELGVSEKLATLILPETGTKKVVQVNSQEANRYFDLGYHLMTNLLGSSFTPTTAYAKRLSISVASNATTIYVSSVLDRDGLVLPLSSTNKGYFTLEPGTSREESIVCTTASSTLNTLSGCTRGLAASGSDETGSSARAYSHNAGSKIIMTDIAQFFGNFVNFASPEAASSFSPTTDYHLTTKTWVENRNGFWEGSAADYASLPTGQKDGEARVTVDDSKLYVWASSTQTWILAGSGGGAGTIYTDSFIASSSPDLKTFTLTSGSWPEAKYLTVYVNGAFMEQGSSEDYVASSTKNSIEFNYELEPEDKVVMRVESISFYNPEWEAVNTDLLPDLDNTHDIGSTTLRFKDGYFSGDLNSETLNSETLNITGTTTLATTTFSGLVSFSSLNTSWELISKTSGSTVSVPTSTKFIIVNYEKYGSGGCSDNSLGGMGIFYTGSGIAQSFTSGSSYYCHIRFTTTLNASSTQISGDSASFSFFK